MPVERIDSKNNGSNKLIDFLKGSSILILSNICLKAINFFLLPLYTKHLTPQMLGVSDSITTFTGILFPILVAGLDSAYSAFYFDKEENRADKVYTTILCTLIVLGVIPMIMAFAAEPLSVLLFGTEEYSAIVIMALFSVSFNIWFLPFSLELRLQNRMLIFGISNVIASSLMVVLNIVFVSLLKMGASALILSGMIVHFEQILFLALAVRKKIERKNFDKWLLKSMLKFAIPLIPMSVMVWVLSLSDRYIILYYLGEDSVGLYGIGMRFVTMLNVVISGVAMAYTTFAFSSKDDEGAKKQYYYIFVVESVLLIIISFTVAIFNKEIIFLMTDKAYEGAEGPLRDLMFAQSIYAMTSVVGYGISFMKKSIYLLYGVIAGSIVNLALNFLLIPKYGIDAAALTTLIGYLINGLIVYYYSEKLYPCNYGEKRVAVYMLSAYLISLLCSAAVLWCKIVVWGGFIAVTVIVFRDILGRIRIFVANMMGR